jgi:CSLREA domain-containing protein
MKNRTPFRFLPISPILLIGLALSAALAPGLYAASFTVNTQADTHDSRPGDGVCADSRGRCSLRAAIEESNAGKAADIVVPRSKSPYFLTQGIPLTIKTNLALVGKEPFRIDGCRPRPSPVPGSTPVPWTPRECRNSHPTNVLQISNPGTQGIVEISGVSIQYGEGGIGFGTGIRIDTGSSLLLKNSAVIENRSDVGGVGISTNGSLTLIACTVEGNMSRGGGGGVTGFGAGIAIMSNVWVRIIASTIRNNVAVYGGGVGNTGSLAIIESTLSGNSASEGGAVVNYGGYLAISDSTIVDNMAGRPTGHPFSRWNGGAISNDAIGELRIAGCTISNNQAVRGGGVANDTGDVEILNSTITGNSASQGGGIYNVGQVYMNGRVQINFSTITNNTSSLFRSGTPAPNNFGGGIYNEALVVMGSTILAGNMGPSYFPPSYGCTNSGVYCYSPDCFSRTDHSNGAFVSWRSNLVGVVNDNCNLEDYSWGNTLSFDQRGTFYAPLNPALGPLANNGGPTKTHALLPGSLAMDSGGTWDCPGTDQRGWLRPAGMYCDTGAFEFGASPP